MFWLGQFELLTPVHTTGAINSNIPLQVTLIKPIQEQPTANPQKKPSKPDSNKKGLEKSQTLKQLMVAIKSDSNAKAQNIEKAKHSVGKTVTSTKSSSSLLDPQPIQVSLDSVILNISKANNFVVDPNSRTSKDEIGSLSQQQVARITAHLNQEFNQYFSYPRLAQRNGWQGMVKLGLRIESNGQLSHIRLLSTSGFPVLDQAALNTLNRISTLQDVDIWLNGLHFDTVLPIQYKLVDS